MAVAALALANAALFALQLSLHFAWAHRLRRVSRRHDTLVSPAPRLAVGTWTAVYLLLSLVIVCDVVAPSSSLFAEAPHPHLLRLLLSAAFAANCLETWTLANGWVYVAALASGIQWVALWTLYLFVIFVAREQHHDQPFNIPRYLTTELGLVLYTAWTAYAMVEHVAMAMQKFFQTCLSFSSYTALLGVFSLVANWGVVFYEDCALGLVGVWILVIVSAKNSTWQSSSIERVHDSVQEAAVQLAVIGATILTILLSLMVSRSEKSAA